MLELPLETVWNRRQNALSILQLPATGKVELAGGNHHICKGLGSRFCGPLLSASSSTKGLLHQQVWLVNNFHPLLPKVWRVSCVMWSWSDCSTPESPALLCVGLGRKIGIWLERHCSPGSLKAPLSQTDCGANTGREPCYSTPVLLVSDLCGICQNLPHECLCHIVQPSAACLSCSNVSHSPALGGRPNAQELKQPCTLCLQQVKARSQ